MTQKQKVTEFEVIDHGIDGSQYFPGCGVYFSNFHHVATGNGDTFAEALDDALESVAQDETNIDVADLEKRILEEWPIESQDKRSAFAEARRSNGDLSDEEWEEVADECDVYYYVSIRWNVADDTEVLPKVSK